MKQPAPSQQRRRPLPEHRPNPSSDDPAALARVEALTASPSYREADRDPDFLVAEGTIEPEDRDLFWYAETAEEIWRDILLWYELKGDPLLPPGAADEFCRPEITG